MEKNGLKDWFRLGAVFAYFGRLFGRKDPSAPDSINLRLMHGINRISVIIFLLAILFFVAKKFLF